MIIRDLELYYSVDPFCEGPRERVLSFSLCFFFEIKGPPFLPEKGLHGHGKGHVGGGETILADA